MPTIYSTLTAPQSYNIHVEKPDGTHAVARSIVINGGHGLTNRYELLLQGASTDVSADDLELLEKHPVFKIHKDNGFVRIDKAGLELEKAISDLEQRDKSSPVTEQDIKQLAKDKVIQVEVDPVIKK